MAVTHSLRKRVVPYRTRLTGRLICEGGSAENPPGPRQFWFYVNDVGACFSELDPQCVHKLDALPLPMGERVGVRGHRSIESA